MISSSAAASYAKSLPGPKDIHRTVLPNGVVVLARENASSPSVTISGYVQAGSVLDPDEKLGLADFTASALTRGTSKHTFDGLFNELESAGASLGFDSGMNSTGFHGHALSEDLNMLLRLLAEALREPIFPQAEVDKLRHHLLTGLAIRMQDTADMADLVFDEILYRGHPYARPEDGNPKTVKAITRRDLARFHRQSFGPRGMVIAAVGAVDPRRVVDAVHKAFGAWRNEAQVVVPALGDPRPLQTTKMRHHKIHGKSQADLLIGTNGPRRRDPEYLAAALGNSVLGQFGMMGRIGKAVREQSGLAYYAYSQLNAGVGPGAWTVSAGVNPGNLDKARDLIVRELRRFVQEGVTPQELRDSKANFIGRLPLSLESNAGVANALLNIERYELGLDYYQRYAERVHAVSRAKIVETARKYIHPDRLVIATAGP